MQGVWIYVLDGMYNIDENYPFLKKLAFDIFSRFLSLINNKKAEIYLPIISFFFFFRSGHQGP